MKARWLWGIALVISGLLAAGCTAPTAEDIQNYSLYTQLRATDAAAAQIIAGARATEAAAAGQMAALTAQAPQEPTPAPAATLSLPLTVTAAVELEVAPSAPATPTVGSAISPTASITTTPTLTATVALSATLTPTPIPTWEAVVQSQQVNLRAGPGQEFDVLGTASRGTTLAVVGSNASRSWWQVCCLDGARAWVSSSVVAVQGASDQVPVTPPLLPDDLSASWAIRWECNAEGCPQAECFAESQARVLQVRSERWLEVQREATWNEGCGAAEDWLTQVDRYTGVEQANAVDPPLFAIWAGADPGPETRAETLLEQNLSLWCTGTRTREVDQGDGWTVVLEGEACYDRAAGVLAILQYSKRWLFSGEFGGQTYEREYFGDYEVYQQILTGTNVPLSGDE